MEKVMLMMQGDDWACKGAGQSTSELAPTLKLRDESKPVDPNHNRSNRFVAAIEPNRF
jgi:hypothetical protein